MIGGGCRWYISGCCPNDVAHSLYGNDSNIDIDRQPRAGTKLTVPLGQRKADTGVPDPGHWNGQTSGRYGHGDGAAVGSSPKRESSDSIAPPAIRVAPPPAKGSPTLRLTRTAPRRHHYALGATPVRWCVGRQLASVRSPGVSPGVAEPVCETQRLRGRMEQELKEQVGLGARTSCDHIR